MSAKLLACLCAIFTLQCGNNPNYTSDNLTAIDTLEVVRKSDSMTKQVIHNALFDTIGVSAAPVKVLTAKLVEQQYSNYKDIRLSWKNVSDKKIAAIRFKWYGLNAFGEPADMGGTILEGFGTGFVDRSLSPGRTDAGEWNINSRDGKKVVLAWPFEVAFEDGTKWKSSN